MGGNSDHNQASAVSDDIGREGDLFGFDGQDAAGMVAGRVEPEKRGRGRPPGAKNRRTSDLVNYIKVNYRDPLLGAVDVANMDTVDLAEHLACTKLEAAKLQLAAIGTAAPYLHSKQPTAVQVSGVQIAPFVINLPEVTTSADETKAHLENLMNTGTYESIPDIVGTALVGTDD